jgi:putative esterase
MFNTLLAAMLALASVNIYAAQGVVLPAWVCAHPDAIFVNSLESGEILVPRQPSQGSGGSYPGNITRQVFVSGLGNQTYYLHLPTHYSPNQAWPMILVLHGAGGPGTSDMYARQVRSDWSPLADSQGFIVASPVGTDSQGGWIAPVSATDHPSDYDIFAAIFDDMNAAYNVENTRRYGWGFSAGGHVMHDLALNGYNAVVNIDSLAGYSVSAGVLAGLACAGLTAMQCQTQVLAVAPRHIPIDIHIGGGDSLYPDAQSDKSGFLASGWTLGNTLFFTVFSDGNPAGGHIYTTAHLQQAWNHLCPNAVTP